MELLKEIDEANVKIHLDAYHMHIEEAGLAQAVATAGSSAHAFPIPKFAAKITSFYPICSSKLVAVCSPRHVFIRVQMVCRPAF